MATIKRKLALRLSKNDSLQTLFQALKKANFVLFHWEERARMTHPGDEDPQKTYYVIRPSGPIEGLFASYFHVARHVIWAFRQGFIPYVDFSDEKTCPYHVEYTVNGTDNAWEYFFCQPSGLSREIIAHKKNVLLSGWWLSGRNAVKRYKRMPEDPQRSELRDLFHNVLPVQPYILEAVESKYQAEFAGKNVLGVYLRGTDYVALEPRGHPRQPDVEQMIEKIREFLGKYPIDRIYVVTEDYGIYRRIEAAFPDKAFSIDDCFIGDYKAGDYVAEFVTRDPYEQGLSYLTRILLLIKCQYLVSSIATGSSFALSIKTDAFIDSYRFDLGRY